MDPLLRNPDAAALGRLLLAARRRAGLSQHELAARVGTTQSVISRWERGRDEPRISTVARVLRACGEVVVVGAEPDVDRAQIRQQLSLTPAERLASAVNVSRTLASARRLG